MMRGHGNQWFNQVFIEFLELNQISNRTKRSMLRLDSIRRIREEDSHTRLFLDGSSVVTVEEDYDTVVRKLVKAFAGEKSK